MNCDDILLYEYLSGSLNPEEAENTAIHLEECQACRERFRIMIALDNSRIPADAGKPRRMFSGKNLLLAAAGLLVAVAVPLLYSQLPSLNQQPGGTSLATSQPYPLVVLETRNSSGVDLSAGLRLYRDGSYREALAELDIDEDNPDALFFSAICLYMLDEPARAAEKLRRVTAVSDKWAEAAEWYLSQSLLKLGKSDEARSLLKKISVSETSYRAEAFAQLKKMEEQ